MPSGTLLDPVSFGFILSIATSCSANIFSAARISLAVLGFLFGLAISACCVSVATVLMPRATAAGVTAVGVEAAGVTAAGVIAAGVTAAGVLIADAAAVAARVAVSRDLPFSPC